MAFVIPNKADALYPRQAGGFSNDIDTIAAALAGDCVLDGLGVTAQGSPDMTVAVAAGLVRIGGYYAYEAGENATITTADSTNDRIDIVVIDRNGAVSVTAGTAAARPVPPAVPANSLQLAQVYVAAGVTSIVSGAIKDKRPVAPDFFDLYDEFQPGALATTGNIGALAWGTSASGTAANAVQAAASLHPGIFRIQSGTTSGNNARMHLGSSATAGGLILPADLARLRTMVRIPTITTVTCKLGIGVDLSVQTAAQWGTAGAFITFDPANSNKWQYHTRQASTTTTNTDTGADVVANNWYQFDIVRLQNGNWQFAKNGVLQFTHSTNQPTTACAIGYLCHTLTAAARNMDIDLFGLNFAPLGNRWT